MAFPALTEAQGKLDQRRKALKDIFDQAGPDMDMAKVKTVDGDTKAKVDHIRALNSEIDDLAKEVEGYLAVEAAATKSRQAEGDPAREPGTDTGAKDRGGRKSIGQHFVESVAFKGRSGKVGPEAHLDISLKALLDTAGMDPEVTRTGRLVEMPQQALAIIDLIPVGATGQSAVSYMEETTYTNNAAEIAEGGAYPEAALGLEERQSPVRKVGTFLPVTDETLEDEPRARSYVENRLPMMVRQRLGGQVLVGNGTAPNLRGLLNTVGVQTQAKGEDPSPDAIYKAMTKVRVTGKAVPGAVGINPTDWQDIRLLRTADGIYIWGSPADSGPDRIWGLPVALAEELPENTAVVGDWQGYSELVMRRGLDIQVSNSHEDYFTTGKQAIRADLRAALIFYRPSAFCTVTGI
ncbi:phage major capsid protein [Nocardiopsis dassonvillei]|uniref:phage major capsid protein n=1 Tax=Nocardiopsis dassonvillei TaxID=2014 RepID=UPI0036F56865